MRNSATPHIWIGTIILAVGLVFGLMAAGLGRASGLWWILFLVGCCYLLAAKIAFGAIEGRREYICRNCGTSGRAKHGYRGSGAVELLLWLFFIIPGLIYSAWRGSNRFAKCRTCGSEALIPADSPAGTRMIYDEAQKRAKKPDPYEEWERSQQV